MSYLAFVDLVQNANSVITLYI